MKVRVVFKKPISGEVSVKYGFLKSEKHFVNTDSVSVEITRENLKTGSCSTIVTVGNFSFFLRDVNSAHPILVPDICAAALPEDDGRSYFEVFEDVLSAGRLSDFNQIESEEEETFERAMVGSRTRVSPTWLGLGPDIRGFWLDYNDMRSPNPAKLDYQTWGYIRPATHYHGSMPSPDASEPYHINFQIGTGPHCSPDIRRWLEDNCLPILHSTQRDCNIEYNLTAFATLERHTLSRETIKGTPNDIAYAFCGYYGNIRLAKDEVDRRRKVLDRSEETVLMVKIRACNTSNAPAYAFFSAGIPKFVNWARNQLCESDMAYTFRNGICTLNDYQAKTVIINRLNGEPMREKEMAVLVMPGEEAVFEMIIPNGPLPDDRAAMLGKMNYEAHYQACRKYWLDILGEAAQVELPEKGLENRVKAGLLHLLLATSGEQTGPLMANVGIRYTPIGSESAPMILTYDWLGLTDIAERCIEYFLERQDENGGIFTYFNYENETGPALWTAGEHFRHTRDTEWLKKHAAALKKSCEYLLNWRNDNKNEECRLAGCYGLQKGKVDDPDDFYHSFYLNAGSWAGIHSLAEAFASIDPDYAEYLHKEAEEYREDILNAIHIARAKSPAIPLCDGTWIQHLPPWTEYTGDPAYYADGGEWSHHSTVFYRVQTNPPLYCGIFGVLDCRSPEMTAILLADQSPHTVRNASYCQPYYVRNDYVFAMRGEYKLFLKTFYNQLVAMQDRETLSFFEHYHSLPYKGHEEAWMLMQIRWMLFLEDGEKLKLFSCAPRRWFASGNRISLQGVRSRFGKLSFLAEGSDAQINCDFEMEYKAETIQIRLPHPEGLKATRCLGGTYDPRTESVTVPGSLKGHIELFFM